MAGNSANTRERLMAEPPGVAGRFIKPAGGLIGLTLFEAMNLCYIPGMRAMVEVVRK